MTDSGRESRRLAVVVGSVLALVLASALLPVISASFHGPPGLSLFQQSEVGPAGQVPGEFAGGQLGALNPGNTTTVGGLDDAASNSLQSLGPEVHFTVESDQPAYWRTGAFGEYTGSGWERADQQRPYDGPLEVSGIAGETVSYRVELNRSASSVPTVWRPRTVSTDQSLVVTDRRGVRGTEQLTVGTVIEGTSVRPPSDPTVLATAGQDYPDAISDRYTQLPDTTPARLTAFTDNLTAGDDTVYDKARTIENWLETNKSYSLDVSRPQGEDVAADFVFEMDQGYCEYFATSMVAMLRTQGVPARYVVGYSTGQPTGENTYTVRGMNAHAWVEVYFPDVGWIRFDPTPGGPRLAVEQASIEQQRPDAPMYNHTEPGSPGEEFSPDADSVDITDAMPSGNASVGNQTTTSGTNGTDTPGNGSLGALPAENDTDAPLPDADDETDDDQQPDDVDFGEIDSPDTGTLPGGDNGTIPATGVEIELSDPPAPGSQVTVTVTYGDDPIQNAAVLFDGEPIGLTGLDGNVTGTVPFSEQLNVTVLGGDSDGDQLTPSVTPPPDARQYAQPFPARNQTALFAASSEQPAIQSDTEQNQTRTYQVETNATVAVSGTVATNQSVVVTATVGEVPVRNATVQLDGRTVGRTDDTGRLTVTLPQQSGNVTLSVSRGPVTGTQELSLPALSIDVEPTLPVTLPWTSVTVTATFDNETVAGVPVTADGAVVGTTDIDGTVEATLPLTDSASLAVSQYGQTASRTIDGLLLNLGLLLGTLVTAVGGVGAAVHYTEMSADEAVDAFAVFVSKAISRAVDVLLAAVDALLTAARGIRQRVPTLLALIAGEVTLAEVKTEFLAWLSTVRERFQSGDDATRAPDGTDTEQAIRTAWGVFLSEVSIRDPTTKTPGELAIHAIERDGLPAEAVQTLRDAFRAVEYGTDQPSQRLSTIERAVETITAEAEP